MAVAAVSSLPWEALRQRHRSPKRGQAPLNLLLHLGARLFEKVDMGQQMLEQDPVLAEHPPIEGPLQFGPFRAHAPQS
jgi:hypothetical protein